MTSILDQPEVPAPARGWRRRLAVGLAICGVASIAWSSAAPLPDISDPRSEGWESEALNDEISPTLHEIESLITGAAAPDEPAVEKLATPDAAAPPLRPQSVTRAFDDGLILIERAAATGEPAVAPLAKALQEFIQPLDGSEHRRAAFKTFSIELTPDDSFRTRQHLSVSARLNGHAIEENAVWLIDWRRSADVPPRISRVQLEEFERATLRHPAPALLTDVTAAAIASPDVTAQVSRGMNHWQRHLEDFLRVYHFGHNGLAVGDADGDALDDVFVCQNGGLPNRLLIHQPDGTVRDRSAAAGLDHLDQTQAALFADFDNDGDQDLAATLATGLVIFENDGKARFSRRVVERNVRDGYSLAAADYDRDGDLDLYACVYFAPGQNAAEFALPVPYFDANNGGPNHLLRNDGSWTFTDATRDSGLDTNNRRFSYAAVWEDIDGDADADLYVANDFGRNNLFLNEGGRFRDVAAERGLDVGAFGMSASAADFDEDGDFDLHLGAMFSGAGGRVTAQPGFRSGDDPAIRSQFRRLARGNFLFCNSGSGSFDDVSVPAGITFGRWAWGSQFADLNNDGREDILVANGFVTGAEPDDL